MSRAKILTAGTALFALLIVSLALGLKLGFIPVGWEDIFRTLSRFSGFSTVGAEAATEDILLTLRLPRVVLAAAAGVGLALSGMVMQALLANPLADPYILGVSSGASLGAVVAIFLGAGSLLGANAIGVFAAAGALAVSFAVLALASTGEGLTSTKLLLSGLALHTVCSAASSFIVFMGGNREGMQSVSYWLLGNVANARWDGVAALIFIVMMAWGFFLTQSRNLNLMLSGGQTAATLGVDLHRCRLAYMAVNALLLGFIVYNAGIIGFIGLIVPHVARSFLGADHWRMIPLAGLMGGVFGVWADVLGRTAIEGIDIPFGVTLALLGGPFFLSLVTTREYSFGNQ